MEALTTLDILYIVLSIFTAIIWTLLTIVLVNLIKILWPVAEIFSYYKKIKQYLSAYREVPDMVKEKMFDLFSSNSEEVVEEDVKKRKK